MTVSGFNTHLNVDVPELSVAGKQLLDVTLATIMSEVSEEESWHPDSLCIYPPGFDRRLLSEVT